ncbi:hypothetical protein PFLmoz3_04697 [Pseudomonas fluorescens]|uniref:Uncharacterized protein n=1 Tax=Pseudomonas fluorescens TaxID=294 RepID=A0A120G6G8_PSEFL|nr:hypothetical protein PFLmoz3_04697 [Pseudomonas fluorescens]
MNNSPTTPNGTGCNCSSSTYRRVLAIGLPMGVLSGTTAPAQSHAVTSTAASVGPYRLYKPTPGNCCLKRRTRLPGRASPLHITRTSPAAWLTSPWARNTSSIDGTKCSVVTPSASITWHR